MKWSQLQSRFIHHEPFTASTAHRECATVRATGETVCARARQCTCVQSFERVYSCVQQHTYTRTQVRVWHTARNRAWLGIARLGIARVARNYSGGSEPRAHGSQSRVARNHVQPHSADLLPAHSAEQRGQEVALIVPPPPPLVPPLAAARAIRWCWHFRRRWDATRAAAACRCTTRCCTTRAAARCTAGAALCSARSVLTLSSLRVDAAPIYEWTCER